MTNKNNKKSETSETSLEALIQLIKDENLDELEISEGSSHVKLVREPKVPYMVRASHASVASHAPSGPASSAAPVQEEGIPVPAPIAGIFYRSPSPTAPSFVKEGDTVAEGKTLCIIEAMKVMNEITAPRAGVVRKIKVENGKSIEANQVLFLLTPS